MEQRFVITGGAGFIGTNFIRHMIKRYPNYSFVNIDKLTYSGNLNNLLDIEKEQNYKFFKEDICDRKAMSNILDEGDVIVNFAAESHVDNSLLDPEIFIKTNVLGTQVLLDVAREKKAKLFVQISTDEVYGSLSFEQPPSVETDTLKPSSPYSASKAAAEMLCFANIHTHKQPIIITRSSNNFGPYQFPEKVIPLFITNIIDGKKVPLYGEGKNVRDWMYVRDNCGAIDTVIHKGSPGEVYNIGGRNEITNKDLTKLILAIMMKDELHINYVEDRKGHDLRYSLNCSKLCALGWLPASSFQEMLNYTVQWYTSNEGWWRPLKLTQGKRTS